MIMSTKIVYTKGDKIGNCTFLEETESLFSPKEDNKRSRNRRRAKFECVCGSIFTAQIMNVKMGNTTSCGCIHKKRTSEISKLNITHGNTKHALYMTWKNMIDRCTNEKAINFSIYGGRGISVCERWKELNNFIEDMYPSYQKGLQLDREKNEGNYEPGNCRWVTRKENSNNRRNNRVIEYNGITMNLGQWAQHLGININTLKNRLNNWTVEKSFTYK